MKDITDYLRKRKEIALSNMTLTDTKYLDYIYSKGWLSLWWKVFKSRVNKQVEILGQGQEKYKDKILTEELLKKFKKDIMKKFDVIYSYQNNMSESERMNLLNQTTPTKP